MSRTKYEQGCLKASLGKMMHWPIAVLLALTVISLSGVAGAYHTEEDRQTDFSAFTLKQNQLRLGLFQQEYGIFDAWMVGTYTLPWLLMPITQSPALNLYTKVKFLEVGGWAASARATAFYFNIQDVAIGEIEDGDFRVSVIPLSLMNSYVFNDSWTASFESMWVQTVIRADVQSTGETTALGAGAQSNFQLAFTGEYRFTKVLAVNLVGRWVPYVTEARISTTADVDGSTEAEIEADIDAENLINAWQVQTGVTFSWKYFNLQLGVGYGNLFLPGLRIVGPMKTVMPDFDIFFRF